MKKTKIAGMGVMTIALMAGHPTKAAVLAYDGFDASEAASDATNGIYMANNWGKYSFLTDDPDYGNEGLDPNYQVSGGNIVGFTEDWSTTDEPFHVLPYGRLIAKRTSGTDYMFLSRKIGDMSQKSVAYGSVLMAATQADPEADAFGLLGFSNPTMSSTRGASVGVDWDNNGHWDIVLRYNDGSAVQKIVKNDIQLNADYLLVWKMDEDNNTIDMWINPASTSATPDASYSNYQGSVSMIEGLTFWVRGMSPNGANPAGVEIDDVTLGDTMEDVFGQTGGYAKWAEGWDVDIGDSSNDYDGDGLLNLYEYGLGGDPTNALDQGTSPEFGIENIGGTNWFAYVHPQLSDPNSRLSYSLELNTDLVAGTWTNAGYVVTGTNVTGGELDFVTNAIDMVTNEKYIRLIIE